MVQTVTKATITAVGTVGSERPTIDACARVP
jgi:hypothetical protein